MSSDVRDAVVILIMANAPVAIVLIFGILRGYTIDLHMSRDHLRRHRRDDD